MIENIIILVVLILLSAFFSASETAIFSLSTIKTRMILEQKKKNSDILYKLKQNPRKLIITLLLGNNIVNISASAFATMVAIDLFGNKGLGISIGIMTFLILVFGEIIPKAMAIERAEKLSLFLAKPVSFILYLFSPLVWMLERITKIVALNRSSISSEEIKTVAVLGFEEGIIKKEQEKFIKKAVEFANVDAKDIMTPRVDIFSLNDNLSLCDILPDIMDSPFSRIPVYSKNRDNITGILHIKDILKHVNKGNGKIKLKELAKKPFIVPEKMAANNLFKEFQQQRTHMAVVVDEHGGVRGIVTMEDLLEELVGDIMDESDIDKKPIVRLNQKTILVNGDAEIENINEFFDIKLSGKGSATIGAIILEKIERIPQKNEKIKINNIILTIVEVTDKEIKKIKIEK